ncbi:MAG TPA: GNAT family N-acetyltransferase [Phycisphaerales bacterium]|nr:GNAT family N-acetyltransferase [Phycisphaerales bacterium]
MDLIEIARLEEMRRARSAAAIADDCRWLRGGGAALRGKRGSWINYAVGLGLEGDVDGGELGEVSRWWSAEGIEPRLEVTPFVSDATLRTIAEAGFAWRDSTSTLFREVLPGETTRAEVPGLELRVVDAGDAHQVRAYGDAVIRGFRGPGVEPTEIDHELSARFVRLPSTVAIAAWMDGRIVGGGTLQVDGEVAALLGASVLPEYRRRGIQQALIAARLRACAERGVRVVTIGSKPGAATERNVRRAGFQVAYTKMIMTKTVEGAVGAGG